MNMVSTLHQFSKRNGKNIVRISHYNDPPPKLTPGNTALSGSKRCRSAAKTAIPRVAMSKLGEGHGFSEPVRFRIRTPFRVYAVFGTTAADSRRGLVDSTMFPTQALIDPLFRRMIREQFKRKAEV
jgi:hypothetical protein